MGLSHCVSGLSRTFPKQTQPRIIFRDCVLHKTPRTPKGKEMFKVPLRLPKQVPWTGWTEWNDVRLLVCSDLLVDRVKALDQVRDTAQPPSSFFAFQHPMSARVKVAALPRAA